MYAGIRICKLTAVGLGIFELAVFFLAFGWEFQYYSGPGRTIKPGNNQS